MFDIPISTTRIALEIIDVSESPASAITSVAASGILRAVYFSASGNACPLAGVVKSHYGNTSDGFLLEFQSGLKDDFRVSLNGHTVQDLQRCDIEQPASLRYYGKLNNGDIISVDTVTRGCQIGGTSAPWTVTTYEQNGSTGFYSAGVSSSFLYSDPLSGISYSGNGSVVISRSNTMGTGGFQELENGVFRQGNTGWLTSPDAFLISGASNPPRDSTDSAVYDHYLNGRLYKIQFEDSTYTKAVELTRLTDARYNSYTGLASNSGAWLSYDARSGFSNKKVCAYALTLLDMISGKDDFDPFTTGVPPVLGAWLPSLSANYCVDYRLSLALHTCENAPSEEKPNEVCITGQMNSGLLQAAIDAAKAKAGLSSSTDLNNALNLDTVETDLVTYTGFLKFNSPASGDKFCFTSYGDNYTGDYSGIYRTAPPYPTIGHCWSFGTDYTSRDTLVTAINASLSGSSYLWHDFGCIHREASGYFESGSVAYATASGADYILLRSARVGVGKNFQFSLTLGTRDISRVVPVKNYLLPSNVKLQGANVYGVWIDLDVRSGVKWENISPIVRSENAADFLNSGEVSRTIPDPDPPLVVSGEAEKTLVYKLTMTGLDKCAKPFSYVTEFYTTPANSGCQTSEDKDKEQKNLNIQAGSGAKDRLVESSYLKTGWKFTPATGYNYYRLYLDGFKASSRGFVGSVSDDFRVSDVNFYSITSGYNTYGEDLCIIGSQYTQGIEGVATGRLTGSVTRAVNRSGLAVWDNELETGIPNGGGLVVFQNALGVPVTPFTGIYNHTETGTAFYTAAVGGYYYNPATSGIYFTENVSGWIYGSGFLSGGPFYIVRGSYISGSAITQSRSGVSSGIAVGTIPNFASVFSNIPSFGYITVTLTGTVSGSNSGYKTFNYGVSGVPLLAYSYAISGAAQATGRMAYNSPTEGDTVYVNGIPLIYGTGLGEDSPTYFDSASEFASILNGNSSYGVSGVVSGAYVNLYALAGGASGNGLSLTSTGAGGVPTFSYSSLTGGRTTYYQTIPSSLFNGIINQTLYATGFFTGLATGVLTGNVRQLDFVREFTGVWNLHTGGTDFRQAGLIAGGKYMGVTVAVSGRPYLLPISVNYLNTPAVISTDMARLRVSGVNMSSGVSILLSGQL